MLYINGQISEWSKSGEKYSTKSISSQLEMITIRRKCVCRALCNVSVWTFVQVSIERSGVKNGNS